MRAQVDAGGAFGFEGLRDDGKEAKMAAIGGACPPGCRLETFRAEAAGSMQGLWQGRWQRSPVRAGVQTGLVLVRT